MLANIGWCVVLFLLVEQIFELSLETSPTFILLVKAIIGLLLVMMALEISLAVRIQRICQLKLQIDLRVYRSPFIGTRKTRILGQQTTENPGSGKKVSGDASLRGGFPPPQSATWAGDGRTPPCCVCNDMHSGHLLTNHHQNPGISINLRPKFQNTF